MQAHRAYLVGVGTAGPAAGWIGRHRSAGRRWSWQAGRHRAHTAAARRRDRPAARPFPVVPRRRALPAGLAALLAILTVATILSGWSAASGAVAVVGMIAR